MTSWTQQEKGLTHACCPANTKYCVRQSFVQPKEGIDQPPTDSAEGKVKTRQQITHVPPLSPWQRFAMGFITPLESLPYAIIGYELKPPL